MEHGPDQLEVMRWNTRLLNCWKSAPKLLHGGQPERPQRAEGRRGIALVLVLSFLVLVTVLVVAFFSSVTTEYTGAKTYANEVSTSQLADSAVDTVIATIRMATSGTCTDFNGVNGIAA